MAFKKTTLALLFFLYAVCLHTQSPKAQNDPLTAEYVNPWLIIYSQEKYREVLHRYATKILFPNSYNSRYIPSIRELQQAYANTADYDPLSKETNEKLLDIAYYFHNAKNEDDKTKYKKDFKNLILQHLGNVNIIITALSLIEQEPSIFDTPENLSTVKNKIIDRLMNSGTGNTALRAYEVFTIDEEKIIFHLRNVIVKETDYIATQKRYYRIHLTEHLETKEQSLIYVNVSTPISKMKEKKDLEDAAFYHQYKQAPAGFQ